MTRRIGISIGDPNGVGNEVALKALAALQEKPELETGDVAFYLIGDPDLIAAQARQLNVPLPELLPSPSRYANSCWGLVDPVAGAASAAWVDEGIAACLKGELDGLVTAPIHKNAWDQAGVGFPGHTELLASRCETSRFGMMLAGKGLRVILATRHIPLRQVAETLNENEIRMAVELLTEGLPLFGLTRPRIAVCGLNPHAGDGGSLGDEEVKWITPLLEKMRQEGLPVAGPRPADTVFHEAVNGDYDAVVALYHDQGLGPLKLWAFDEGVNITLGLPMIRTSPDHGTAFGIAGKGIARPQSMIEALRSAAQLTQQENPWKKSFPV